MNCNPQEHPVLFPSAAAAPTQFYYHSLPGQPQISFPSPPGYPPMQPGTPGQFYNGTMDPQNFYVGSQNTQPLMMPLAPPMMYMQHPVLGNGPFMQPFYAPAQGGPNNGMYFQDAYMSQANMASAMSHPMPSYSQESTHSSVRPLSTSTPLPTEFPNVCAASQLPNMGHLKIAHLKYHATMDHDDVLANVSRITISSSSAGDTTIHENDISDTDIAAKVQQPVGRKSFVPFNYKTRLCSSYANNKPCEMGGRCRFAHGMEELRQVDTPVRPPNMRYKTKLCKNYTVNVLHDGQQAYCPYGLRCEFIHPTDKEFPLLPAEIRSLVPASVLMTTGPADVTPEDVYYCQPSSISGSVVKVNSHKMPMKHRNIAGSLMCLASSGSSRGASESGSYESGKSQAYFKPNFKYSVGGRNKNFPPRRAVSTQNINRWKSTDKMVEEEN